MNWTPQQESAITTTARYVCVDAGAGSGKTRVLIDRILHLIEARDARLEDIVAITFTDKAAAEMKERLRRSFHKKAPPDDVEAMNKWRDLEQRVVHARISTIHAFCMSILRENALRLGRDPDFGVLAETDSVLLRIEVVRDTLHALLGQDDADALHLATAFGVQRLAATLQQLLQRGVSLEAWKQDIATLPPEAQAEALLAQWRRQVQAEHEARLDQVWMQPEIPRFIMALEPFEGICQRPIDEREERRRRLLEGLHILKENPEREIVRHTLENMKGKQKGLKSFKRDWPDEAPREALTKLLDDLQAWVQDLIEIPEETTLDAEAAALTAALYRVYGQISQAFEAAKAERNAFDFDNLIQSTCHALESNTPLRNRVAQGIRYLLIDEFQDTDQTQLKIARLLCEAPEAPALFIVGDPKQSIYYFRGADVTVFRAARAEAEEQIPLDKNFRTLPDVLNFVNGYFAVSGLLNAVEHYAPMAVHREVREEQRIEFILADDEDITPGEDGKRKVSAEDRRRREAALIAARIRAICEDPAYTVYDETLEDFRPVAYGDIVLLFRSMSNVHLYEAALRQADIPYALVAGRGFYERQEIRDLLQFLKVLIDSGDEMALTGFLRGPFAHLSDETLMRLAQEGGLATTFHSEKPPTSLTPDSEEQDRLEKARALVRHFRTRLEQPVAQLLREILEHSALEAILLDQFLGAQRVSNLRKLIGVAEDFSRSRPHTLRGFIAYLEEVRGGGIREGEAVLQPEGSGAVLMMTIHKSKGLEFPVVFIPDMGQGRVGSLANDCFIHPQLGLALKSWDPSGEVASPAMGQTIQARINDEEKAEHARLLYVALTRARDYLVLSGAMKYEKRSWLEAMDQFMKLSQRRHGSVLKGKGWQARITRQLETTACAEKAGQTESAGETTKGPSTKVDIAAQLKRIDHIPAQPRAFAALSISSVMDYLTEGLEEEATDDEAQTLKPHHRSARYAMARGTAVHRLFEEWDFAHDVAPDIPVLLRDSGLSLARRAALTEELEKLVDEFREQELFALLQKADDLQRETPFLLPLGDALLSGTLDALLDRRIIVDYKTGQCTPERQRRYRWQVALYAAAVERLLGAPAEEGILYYVDQGTLDRFPIDNAAVKEALEKATEIMHSVTT